MLVGRPSDEKSGGALLHADNANTAAASGNGARKRDARTLKIFIRKPLFNAVFIDLASMPCGAFGLPRCGSDRVPLPVFSSLLSCYF
jgi:hypothetical protein